MNWFTRLDLTVFAVGIWVILLGAIVFLGVALHNAFTTIDACAQSCVQQYHVTGIMHDDMCFCLVTPLIPEKT